MNFYKRHIGDYLKKTAHLSLLEHGVYTRLLDVYYTREDGIPKVEAARLIGARTRDEKAALDSVLNEFFECFDGVWRQGRCDEEIAHANQKAERNREIGKKGGRPPKKGTHGNGGQEPKNNPDGFRLEPTSNPIQTPDSRLQTPESEIHTALPRDAHESGRFDEIRQAYPKRAGDHRWKQAEQHYRRRLKKGESHEEILAAVRRYASSVQASGSEGTQFVKQAATFLNSDEAVAKDWKPPPTRGQQREDRNISASLQWLAEQEANDASH